MVFGSGMLRGLWVTLKNFFYSYFKGPEAGGLFTVEYPEKRLKEKEYFRNFPFLVYDESPENPRCVACEICARECPTKCIAIERAVNQDGKPLRKPARFDIDLGICMNCGICEEVCPFDSIFMDHAFEITSPKHSGGLLYNKEKLLKSNKYFHKIRPQDAKAIDEKKKSKTTGRLTNGKTVS